MTKKPLYVSHLEGKQIKQVFKGNKAQNEQNVIFSGGAPIHRPFL
jgi:hypothetical protein